jgi:hypothetical protein
MSKATLKFNLEDPDDRMEFQRASKSTDMALALWQILYNTKKEMMYAIEAKENAGEEITPYDAIEMYREKLGEIIYDDYGINIDNLIN